MVLVLSFANACECDRDSCGCKRLKRKEGISGTIAREGEEGRQDVIGGGGRGSGTAGSEEKYFQGKRGKC